MTLYNAHIHLDLRPVQPIAVENGSFADWVVQVVRFRQSGDFQPEAAIREGLAESARAGVGHIADIYQPGVPFEAYLPRARAGGVSPPRISHHRAYEGEEFSGGLHPPLLRLY